MAGPALLAVFVLAGVPLLQIGYAAGIETLLRALPERRRWAARPWLWLAPALGLLGIFLLYPAALIPKAFDAWVRFNPLAWYSERMREILLQGSGLVLGDIAWAAACLAVFGAGIWFFNRLSPNFEDFL